ncbi:hypothetical protein [Natronosalvus vescus]|uniref:hypothetical protein n=1 Tax=Natronosalvus vescus TaxID=2953881 RepID=UPI002091788E|nr:hypothetical protein [Natronosalvus vescus]
MRHAQDDLLIVEALIQLSREIEEFEPDRADRAWELAIEIAAQHGLSLEDAVLQIE